jgi:hypothetical protein
MSESQRIDDGVRWLALVLAELFRVGLSLIAKRYPEARGQVRCGRCGHRQQVDMLG